MDVIELRIPVASSPSRGLRRIDARPARCAVLGPSAECARGDVVPRAGGPSAPLNFNRFFEKQRRAALRERELPNKFQ